MNWDDYYEQWNTLRDVHRLAKAHGVLRNVLTRMPDNKREDWDWLYQALSDPEKKWFVAAIFRYHSLPKRFFRVMMRAAVYERDPSFNKWFVRPCVETFGPWRVCNELLEYLRHGTNEEKGGAANAYYHVPFLADGVQHVRRSLLASEVEDVRLATVVLEIECLLLKEFVVNDDVSVRRRVLPFLSLRNANSYPEEFRPFVQQAIHIARHHPDEYIRHRLKVQLGSGGPYMALPDD